MKKVISTLLSAILLSGCVAGLVACDNKDDPGANATYRYNIDVWVGDKTKSLTQDLINKFNRENELSVWFYADVNEVTESKASGDLQKLTDPPEIFCFAQDQIAELAKLRKLAAPTEYVQGILENKHSTLSLNAASVGGKLYAYPLTEDNGVFLYYNTDKVTETEAQSIEGIISACQRTNSTLSVNLEEGWINAAFFYAAGAHTEFTVNDLGEFTAHDDTYNSDEGLIAAKGLQKIYQSGVYSKTGGASDFSQSTPAAALISGVWDYTAAKDALKDKLGIAKLPSYTVDDTPYYLQSFIGCKLLGVTNQEDPVKASALSILAEYLTNEYCQMERFKAYGWGPSVIELQDNDEIKDNEVLKVLKATATIPQGQYPIGWWTEQGLLAGRIKGASSDAGLKNALSLYAAELDGMLD